MSKVKRSHKSKYDSDENHIVLYVSAHGAEMLPEGRERLTRRCDFNYGNTEIRWMTFAGLANITTDASTIRNDIGLPSGLSYSTYSANPTEYVVLSGLVPKIYRKKNESMNKKFEHLLNGIIQLGKASGIHYSSTSPPSIEINPCMNKRWLLRYLKGENERNSVFPRPDGVRPPSRYLTMRMAGDPLYNAVMAIPGVYILDTNNNEDSHFTLYNKMTPGQLSKSKNINQIRLLNIFTKKNYTNYWESRIEDLDFTGILPQEVFDIDFDITFLFELLKDIGSSDTKFKELYDIIIAIYNEKYASQVIVSKRVLIENRRLYKEKLTTVNELTRQLNDMQIEDPNYEMIEQNQRVAEVEYNKALDKYTKSKNENITLENTAANEMCEIIKNWIREIIDGLLKPPVTHKSRERLGIIFNIIMKRKLENIIKSAILHGRLSFRQLVILFRGLGYKNIYIVDPSCFTIEQVKHLSTRTVADIDTLALPDEMDEDVPEGSPVSRQSLPESLLNSFRRLHPPLVDVGGTIRKKSRKRRTRKNRDHTTRRRVREK